MGEQAVTLDTRIRTIKLLEGISFVKDTPYESLKDKEKEGCPAGWRRHCEPLKVPGVWKKRNGAVSS